MNDDQRMLADMAGNLFADLGVAASLEQDWSKIEEVALGGLLVEEAEGGFGGSWEDAFVVLRLAGYHALALPVAEAILAAKLAKRTEGRGTIASGISGTLVYGKFSGEVTGLCYADGADFAVAPAPDGTGMIFDLAGIELKPGKSLADEPRAAAMLDNVPVTPVDANVYALGALMRVAQVAGALDAALEKSVEYANERQQFGRPLAKFQAVQQNLATFACEAAAANCAAMGAAQAMSRGNAAFEIAAAKVRTGRAIGISTSLAHQVHGAIGFTQEFSLHPLTRRLWAWRSEFGNDAVWSDKLGGGVIARGAANFWPDLTALTG